MSCSSFKHGSRIKIAITLAHYLSFLTLGLSIGIVGPTLLDLRQQVNSTLTAISFALTARSAGYVVGSVAMGLLFPKLNFSLATTVVMLVSAVMTILIPFMSELMPLLAVSIVNGVFLGSYDTGTYVFIMQQWGKNSGSAMQALMFMYGAGNLLAPLLAEPFLVSVEERGDSIHGVTISPSSQQLQLVYPYGIIAVISLINAIIHLILWIICHLQDETRTTEKQISNEDTNTDTSRNQPDGGEENKINRGWKIVTMMLSILFMHIYYGLEITFGSFILTFAVESDLKLSKAKGAYLTTLFWTSMTVPKVLALFLVKWLGNEMTIVVSLIFNLAGNVILVPFGNKDEICLWVGVVVIGIGLSSIYACLISYVGELFHLSSSMSSSLVVSAMVGEFVFPFIISAFVEHYPLIFLWVVLFCSGTITVLFAVIMILKRTKFKK